MDTNFTDQVATHALALKGYALFLTQNKEEAHDLLQETYLKAFSNRDRFAPDTNLKGWLYTIMKNTFINNYRRKVKRNTFSDQTDQDYYINQPSQRIPNQAESKMVMDDLSKAMTSPIVLEFPLGPSKPVFTWPARSSSANYRSTGTSTG
jgi:RNA polymerase sigma-70 factor (ECF subfamily)